MNTTQENYNKFLNEALYKYYTKDIFLTIYGKIPKQRDYTFTYCIDFLEKRDNIQIAELGTSRSFVDGKFDGVCCNDTKYWSPDNPEKWDWSAGIFTKYFSTILNDKGKKFKITSVDIDKTALSISKKITENLNEFIEFKLCSSEEYIKNQPKKSLDILYLDTGNMDEETALLHLREAKLLIEHQIIKDDGIILIDDVRNPAMVLKFKENNKYGKSKYAIPFFLENGYEIIIDEYQVVLKKYIFS